MTTSRSAKLLRRTFSCVSLGRINPVAEVDANGNTVTTFVYGTGINVPDYMERGGDTYAFVRDHLGSVRLVVDADTGAVAQELRYDEFGNVTLDTNPGFQPFGYAGGLYDPETGLVRFGARDYDPRIGRWTAPDPIGFGGGQANLYVYARNNSVGYADPDGRLPFAALLIPAAIGGIGNALAHHDGSPSEVATAFAWGFAGGAVSGFVGAGAAGLGASAALAAFFGTAAGGAATKALNLCSSLEAVENGVAEDIALAAVSAGLLGVAGAKVGQASHRLITPIDDYFFVRGADVPIATFALAETTASGGQALYAAYWSLLGEI